VRHLGFVLLAGLIAGALGCGIAAADSVFSAHGLGEVVTGADVRGRGMGGASVAVPDPWNLSPLNPAVVARIPGFILHGEVVRESRRVEVQGGEVRKPRSTALPLLRLAVPVPKVGALALGLAQYTDVSYVFENSGAVDGEPVTQILRGKNGLNLLDVGWARQVHPQIDVGADVGFVLGSYVDVWENRFDNPEFTDSIDSLIVNHSRGPILRLGMLASPRTATRLGAAFTFGRDIELRPEVRTSQEPSRRLAETDLHLPAALALGGSHDLDSHWRLAADLVHTRWASTELGVGVDSLLTRPPLPTLNVTRLAVGVEYRGDRTGESKRLRDRVALRAGYGWEPWHFRDPFGEKITDHVLSGGLAVPMPEDAGVLQVAVELVMRGDEERNGVHERVVRMGVGLAVRERVLVGRVPGRKIDRSAGR
jgi:hypothetical protein